MKAVVLAGLVCGPLVAMATTNHYYFINNSNQSVFVRWGQSGQVVAASPWQKVGLGSDKNEVGNYQLSIAPSADQLNNAPLQYRLQTAKDYHDQSALTQLSASATQVFALKAADQFLPTNLTRSVKQVQLNASGSFTWQGCEYQLHQADIQYNNFLYPTREIDISLDKTISHYQRNDNDAKQLDVLSYNVQLWDDFSALGGMRLNRATRRADLIPHKIAGYDVVVAEELMSEDGLQGRRKRFADGMRQMGYPYQYGPIPRKLGISGGVMIFSHWPLSRQQQFVFPGKDANGVDDMSSKGVLFTDVNKNGQIYHVFATHTQADEPKDSHPKDVGARERQFQDFNGFIQAQHIKSGEPVIVAGDLNVDYQNCKRNHDCAEYQVTIGQLTGRDQLWQNSDIMPYGSNPAINLMNTDDVPEMVDYILMLDKPELAAPAFTKRSRIRVIRAPEDAEMYAGGSAMNLGKTPFAELDLSDHFAFEAEFHLQ